MFAEKQNFALPGAVQADVVEGAASAFPQTYKTAASVPSPVPMIAAGTVVDSFYIHAEPVGHPLAAAHYTATVRFDRPIVGLFLQWEDNTSLPPAAGPLTLNNTDAILGAPGVNYNTPPHGGRGMEFPPGGHDDVVTVVNAQTLSLDLVTGTETDDLRVVTQGSPPGTPSSGYRFVASDGGIFNFGNLQFFGSEGGSPLNKPMVGGASTCDNAGYWTVASDGGIFSFGDAKFFGSMGNKPLNKPIVTMASTPDSKGYWMFASDGGVFSFGDAAFHGSTGNIVLNKPIVSAASTPSGNGYWMAATDGGIFTFGDAGFHGSTGNIVLNKPVVGMAPTPDGQGYWLVASDGGIFTFGDAGFHGSTGNIVLNKPIVGMKVTPSGKGYWLIASDGGVFSFGDAQFFGSTGNIVLNKPIVGVL
jgi:hypothetical protein